MVRSGPTARIQNLILNVCGSVSSRDTASEFDLQSSWLFQLETLCESCSCWFAGPISSVLLSDLVRCASVCEESSLEVPVMANPSRTIGVQGSSNGKCPFHSTQVKSSCRVRRSKSWTHFPLLGRTSPSVLINACHCRSTRQPRSWTTGRLRHCLITVVVS